MTQPRGYDEILDAAMNKVQELEGQVEDLVAACKAAYDLLTRIHDGGLGHHKDNPVPAQLRAAITKAEGTDG